MMSFWRKFEVPNQYELKEKLTKKAEWMTGFFNDFCKTKVKKKKLISKKKKKNLHYISQKKIIYLAKVGEGEQSGQGRHE
jgi:hypothetical protein